MEEGTILQWLKQVGDEIAVGDELVEIETDKANMAYESDVAGTLSEILAQEGETVAIGAPSRGSGIRATDRGLGRGACRGGEGACGRAEPVLDPRSSAPPAEERTGSTAEARLARRRLRPTPQTQRRTGIGQGVADSQAACQGEGLDLSQLEGSGPGGRIVKADVESAAASAGGAGAGASRTTSPAAPSGPRDGTRGAAPRPTPGASEAPETAKGEVSLRRPHEAAVDGRPADGRVEGDGAALLPAGRGRHEPRGRGARRRSRRAAGEGDVVPSFNDMVVKACALALREHPRANGAYRDGRFELYSRVNVGIAVAADDALVVPTVFDADRKGLRQIASESRALAQRVRDGAITPPELSGATFTVSNLGMYGIDSFSAVINPPQAAILAVGAIRERPVAREGEIVHRATDAGRPRLRPPHPLRRSSRGIPRPDPRAAGGARLTRSLRALVQPRGANRPSGHHLRGQSGDVFRL